MKTIDKKQLSIIRLVQEMMGLTGNQEVADKTKVSMTSINHCTAPASREQYERIDLLKQVFGELGIRVSYHTEEPVGQDGKTLDYMMTGDGYFVVFHWVPGYNEYEKRFRKKHGFNREPFKIYPVLTSA